MKISTVGLVLRGMAMGIAEIIPGVSGGTIAFITGIYKRLLDAITSVNGEFVKILISGKIVAAFNHIDGFFLLRLIGGMALGIVAGVFGVSFMLESYPEIIWGLFFGLILASVPYMLTQLKAKFTRYILHFIIGAVIAYGVTVLVPAEGSESLILYIFRWYSGNMCTSACQEFREVLYYYLLGLYSVVIPTLKVISLSEPSTSSFLHAY